MMTDYMREVLALAEQGRTSCAPNPMVGCIIVNRGLIVGRGWHQRAGEPHAEIMALNEAGVLAAGAEIYVNLEPCCHIGKTGSCVTALIAAKVKTVYLSVIDPNPLVAGQGVAQLRSAGITVHIGDGAEEATVLNQVFFHYIKHQQPFIIGKWAMSLDGKISVPSGQSRQLTSSAALAHSHHLRREVAAILIGANTAMLDDPQLTVRLKEIDIAPQLQPWRIILSAKGDLPLHLQLFNTPLATKTIVYTTEYSTDFWRQRLTEQGVTVVIASSNEKAKIDLLFVLKDLAQKQISSVLVEGGAQVLTSFYNQSLLQKIILYLAPRFINNSATLSPLLTLEDSIQQEWQIEKILSLSPDVGLILSRKEKKYV